MEPSVCRSASVFVSAPGRELLEVYNDVLYGAAPRPGGGFVLLIGPAGQSRGEVTLFVVDGAGASRRIHVTDKDVFDTYTLGVVPTASDVFDVVSTSNDSISRRRVNAASGEIQSEDVSVD